MRTLVVTAVIEVHDNITADTAKNFIRPLIMQTEHALSLRALEVSMIDAVLPLTEESHGHG
jgi:hypothetical protein